MVALPTVILAFLFGQSRIFFVMARDGVLPPSLATIDPRTGTPLRITAATAAIVATLAGFVPLARIAALANAGTLLAFVAVAGCMLILRRRDPHAKRVFRTLLAWIVGPAAITGCVYLFFSLPYLTRMFFFGWNALGLVCYAAWRQLGRGKAPPNTDGA